MKVIGIDLGTTNSCIAYVNDKGIPEVIPSSEGGRTTPSVFAYTQDKEKLVGAPAVDQELMNPSSTIRSIKRRMGTNDRLMLNDKEFSPEEISSEILKKLKEDAESFLNDTVEAVVITVPAYFNNDQRKSTTIAGELAGLKVLRIINEPTAASLAYGLDKNKDETVLVFDLGGGTFDVTILKILDGMDFLVQSTSGDTFLGGDDFDQKLEKIILSKAEIQEDVLDENMKVRLREAAEKLKKELTSSKSSNVYIPYFYHENGLPKHLKVTVTRQEFEKEIEELIEKAKKCVDQAILDAKITYSEIDEVVFVGGSTRVPKIAESVELWTGKVPNRSINPDEAVAIGAAIQASVLSGQSDKEIYLVDVSPLTLGIETAGGVMTKMIERNTPVPASFSDIYSTAEDNQKLVEIKVYQGERPQTKDNKFLGKFSLEVDPAPRGAPQIEVTFDVDANGILSVSAIDKITGLSKSITLTGNSSLSSEEVQRMLKEAEENKEEDALFTITSNLQSVVRDQLIQVEELLRDNRDYFTEELIYELEDLLPSLEQGQTNENLELLRGLVTSTEDILKMASKQLSLIAESLINSE